MKHETPRSVKTFVVIEIVAIRGEGVIGDPVREVKQYWHLDGYLVAERDSFLSDQLASNKKGTV